MTSEDLQKLINKWENAKVDFKREWYWNSNMPNKIITQNKNELIKDIIALTNGDIYSINETAHLIIGITDDTREVYSFDKTEIIPLDKLKQELLTSLNNYSQPEFLTLDMEIINEVLIISIPPRKELISLSKDLQLKNGTDKKGITYYRIGEDIHVASSTIIKEFEKIYNTSLKSVKAKTYIENINNTGIINFN